MRHNYLFRLTFQGKKSFLLWLITESGLQGSVSPCLLVGEDISFHIHCQSTYCLSSCQWHSRALSDSRGKARAKCTSISLCPSTLPLLSLAIILDIPLPPSLKKPLFLPPLECFQHLVDPLVTSGVGEQQSFSTQLSIALIPSALSIPHTPLSISLPP